MRLYLIRHPQTSVAPDICYGSTDLPVADEALEAVLARLIPTLPKGLPLSASPLLRCAALARRLHPALDSPAPDFDARLAEMHFGDWEMRAWSAIPRVEVDAWVADLAGYRPGNGECVRDMARRVRAARDDLVKQGGDRIVVCHAGTIRLLLACSPERSLEEIARAGAQGLHRIGYGEVVIVDC